jgi:hypothetical protein
MANIQNGLINKLSISRIAKSNMNFFFCTKAANIGFFMVKTNLNS